VIIEKPLNRASAQQSLRPLAAGSEHQMGNGM